MNRRQVRSDVGGGCIVKVIIVKDIEGESWGLSPDR